MSNTPIMTWAAAMRVATLHIDLAVISANQAGGEEDTTLYVRVAEIAIEYAREVREATDGKSMQTIERMMQE